MTTAKTRPEDRQRSGRDGADWADTEPLYHRSEAFAEDLSAAEEATQPPPGATTWHRTASMPLLSLTLAAVLGPLGR